MTDLQLELEPMDTGGDITELLRPYLQEQHAISEEALRRLLAEWNQQGSFVDFLVGKQLLPRSTARTLEAVRKGYLSASIESVLGLPAKAAAVPSWESIAAPAPSAAPSEAIAPQSLRPAAAAKYHPVDKPVPGMHVGRYILQEQLGEGATATVFRAFNETLNFPVAIKIFAPLDGFADPGAAARFRHEAQTLVRLEHPHIVRILDADIAGPFPYIVMEYVGETTLETQIRNLGKLPAARIAQIGLAVAEALEAASKAGLLHRDVKPANILERRDGHIKLVDFGIAAKLRRPDEGNEPARGLISGTPLYIAPEQVMRPERIDFRADMYGLGATLYHAAVGRPPLVRDTVDATLRAHIHDEPIPIWQLDPSFDVNLAATIHRMLRKDPDERFGSWVEVRAALAYAPVVDSAVTPARSAAPKPLPGTLEFAEPASAAESEQSDALLAALQPLPGLGRAKLPRELLPLAEHWSRLPPTRQITLVGILLLIFLLVCIWFGMRA